MLVIGKKRRYAGQVKLGKVRLVYVRLDVVELGHAIYFQSGMFCKF